MSAYEQLEQRFQRMSNLGGAAAVLQWDWATIMPAGGAEARAAQLSELDVIRHELMTDPKLGDLLGAAELARADLGPWQDANLSEMRHRWAHANALPADLVAASSTAASTCELVWREARASNDFPAFQKAFEPLLGLIREKAEAKAAALGLAPYDALIDGYDPGFACAEIDVIFDDLAGFLPAFLAQVLDKQAHETAPLRPTGPFAVAQQRALSRTLMERIGFDFGHGRLDESHHPFCGGVAEDVRITTRYDELDFTSSLMGVLHETGHALYERGLPAEWRTQPVGESRSMSLHESQSLLMEMQVCRGGEFIGFAAPLMREAFAANGSEADPAFAPDNLQRMALIVAPDFIRVDADEVTYPAHIMLRYRLEKAMIAGDLQATDLPDAWREGMREFLGLTPRNDGEGCLQDIHWAGGDIGYFPSYTLGALIAAQLFESACHGIAGLRSGLAAGEFADLLTWLRGAVHSQASRYSSHELIERATGRPLSTDAFKAHLQARYLG
ncbi:MAG: carboxypeptidase M32 [Proteobacteria bacterium]|nr:carboxypeptidase M32 [Pseudomonadota bacterium]MDA1355577.1 carboxypeptidase M32 [Pseudomonadota bacterium]